MNLADNFAYIQCVMRLMAAVVENILNQVPSIYIPSPIRNFCKTHENDTNLIDKDSWDADMINYVKLEFLLSLNIEIISLLHHVI